MFYIDWKMTLAVGVVLPLVVLPVGKFGRKIRHSSERSQSRLGELSQILQETVTGNRVVKAFGMEDFEIRKSPRCFAPFAAREHALVRAAVATAPLMDLLGAVVIPLLLLYARDRIKMHQMTPGIFLAFLYAMFNAYMPLKRIGQVYQQFQYAQGASAQVFFLLGSAGRKERATRRPTVAAIRPRIEFDDVSFSYGRNDAVILQDVRLRARRGEVIALVGTSGAGKTT